MLRLVLPILIPLTSIPSITFAHEIANLHQLCSSSNDYQGCIQSHKELIDSSHESSIRDIGSYVQYGSLRLDIESLRRKENKLIIPFINTKLQKMYLAIDCKKSMINVTEPNLQWKSWAKPIEAFEFNLINDLCRYN